MTINDTDVDLTYHEKSDQTNLEILQKAFKTLRTELIAEFADVNSTIGSADNIYYIILPEVGTPANLWKVGVTDDGAIFSEQASRGTAQDLFLDSPDDNIWDITIDSDGRLGFEDTGSTLSDPLYLSSANNYTYLIASADDGRITTELQ